MTRWATAVLLAGALTALVGVTPARAQTTNSTDTERTILTFKSPVQVPGMTLPAGDYQFRIGNGQSSESEQVVQIYDRTGTKLLTSFFAKPTRRPPNQGDPYVTFTATGKGTPAIKTWFAAGSADGHEFAYPSDQAQRVAQMSNESVLSTSGSPSNMTASRGYWTINSQGERTPYGGSSYATASNESFRDREHVMSGATGTSGSKTGGTSASQSTTSANTSAAASHRASRSTLAARRGSTRGGVIQQLDDIDELATKALEGSSTGTSVGTSGRANAGDTVTVSRADLESIRTHAREAKQKLERRSHRAKKTHKSTKTKTGTSGQ